jgi:hypothetical protein
MQVRDAVNWETTGVFDAVAAGRSREAILRARFAPGLANRCCPTPAWSTLAGCPRAI